MQSLACTSGTKERGRECCRTHLELEIAAGIVSFILFFIIFTFTGVFGVLLLKVTFSYFYFGVSEFLYRKKNERAEDWSSAWPMNYPALRLAPFLWPSLSTDRPSRSAPPEFPHRNPESFWSNHQPGQTETHRKAFLWQYAYKHAINDLQASCQGQ